MTPYKYSKYEYKYNYKKCGAIDFLDISHDASLIYDYSTSKKNVVKIKSFSFL